MISEILKRYNELIISYEIKKFHQVENSYALVVDNELRKSLFRNRSLYERN